MCLHAHCVEFQNKSVFNTQNSQFVQCLPDCVVAPDLQYLHKLASEIVTSCIQMIFIIIRIISLPLAMFVVIECANTVRWNGKGREQQAFWTGVF